MKERFGRPAFAIALEPGGIGTGSGRSITGVDLGRAVRHAASTGLVIKGGGHAMAAGVTLRKDALIALPAHTLVYAEEVGQSHMRARLRAGDGSIINAVAFRAAGQKLGIALGQSRGRSVHAAGTLCLDRWNGVERVQLRLIDIAPADASLGIH